MTTLVSHSFVVVFFLSVSARSCVPRRELKMVFRRQTTSFHRASVISCGISGARRASTDQPALQGGPRVQASRISNYCVELLI